MRREQYGTNDMYNTVVKNFNLLCTQKIEDLVLTPALEHTRPHQGGHDVYMRMYDMNEYVY